jgi:glutamine synthetase
MVGSTQSISDPNVILNTIVADALCEVADELEKADNFDLAVHDMIKKNIAEHKRVIFNGNGYSDEWVAEAERRGLPNLKSMVDAIPELVTKESIEMFEKHGVYTKAELYAREEVSYEQYSKVINIEALSMIDMAKKQIVPAVIKYQTSLAESINSIKAACPGVDTSVQEKLMDDIAANLTPLYEATAKLEKVEAEASAIEDVAAQARYYHDVVFATMDEVRTPADALEMLVAKEAWPFPSYGDLLFEV